MGVLNRIALAYVALLSLFSLHLDFLVSIKRKEIIQDFVGKKSPTLEGQLLIGSLTLRTPVADDGLLPFKEAWPLQAQRLWKILRLRSWPKEQAILLRYMVVLHVGHATFHRSLSSVIIAALWLWLSQIIQPLKAIWLYRGSWVRWNIRVMTRKC